MHPLRTISDPVSKEERVNKKFEYITEGLIYYHYYSNQKKYFARGKMVIVNL